MSEEALPWWVWLVIWGSLTMALLAVLGVATWLLFGKFMRVMDELGELADTTAVLDGAATDIRVPRPQRAILSDFGDVQRRAEARSERRGALRLARRKDRLRRAKMITNPLTTRRTWPDAW